MPRRACLAALLTLALAACGPRARSTTPTPPAPTDATTDLAPADDLATATQGPRPTGDAGGRPGTGRGAHYDLEEIRLVPNSAGGIDAIAPSTLLDQAKAALDAGHPTEAMALYRQLAADFPTSRLAPAALFNVGVIHENLGDTRSAIAAYRDLVARFPRGRESLDGHLRVAGLEAEASAWIASEKTLREIAARDDVSFLDRIEINARLGYVLMEQGRAADARLALEAAVAAWRRATHVDDPYFIAMAHYYLGELAAREFAAVPLRSADELLKADLVAKEKLAAAAYDRWKQALEQKDPYWALAAGYRMSQIFMELWETAVRAPYPDGLSVEARALYVSEVHERVRRHLHTALEGHDMNVKLAAAYGVDNAWSRASKVKAGEITAILAREAKGEAVVPTASAVRAP